MSSKNFKSKSRKIIFYSAVPFFNTWPRKWKFDKFKNYGFDIELWSMEKFFFKQEDINNASSGSKEYLYNDMFINKFRDFKELEKKVSQLKKNDILFIISRGELNDFNFDNPDLDIFNKHNIKYVCQHPIPYVTFSSIFFKIKYFFRHLRRYLFNYKNLPYLIVGSGRLARKQVFKTYRKNFKYKSVPFFDVLWDEEKPIIDKEYIVYVDETADISPDSFLFQTPHPVKNIDEFYKNLNDLFYKIERWSNLKIVIAASGKYHYQLNPFHNRTIIYKKTSNLIKYSKFVIGHCSTALAQAIVDYKPLFLFKDEMFTKTKNKKIKYQGKLFGINSIWTKKITKKKFEEHMIVNDDQYNKIINEYYRENGVEGNFVDNLISALR